MSDDILLSICIPTYNRAQYLDSALEKLFEQYHNNFELVIVDGGSKDETKSVIEKYKYKFSNYVSYIRDENVGIDADVLKMVDLANGEYCWLLSDDDEISPGCIDKVVEKIKSFDSENLPSGFSLNISAYNPNMEYTVSTVPSIGRGKAKNDMVFSTREEAFKNLGVHLGFLSAQIINREIWQRSIKNKNLENYFNAWLLVYVIGKMLEINPYWIYLHKQCVHYRSGNDSFIQRMGVVNRQKLAHYELPRIVGDLFGFRSEVYNYVLNTMLHDRMARSLAVLKASGITINEQLHLLIIYFHVYKRFPMFWFKILPLFFVPSSIYRLAKKIYMKRRSKNRLRLL